MGFLMVSRMNVALSRYVEARKNLGILYTETIELVQQACVYSLSKNRTQTSAKEWRNDVAYNSMVFLRVVQAVLDYPSRREPAWMFVNQTLRNEITTKIYVRTPKFSSGVQRGEFEEQIRIPGMIAYKVREAIEMQSEALETPLAPLQERALRHSVDRSGEGWTHLRYFLTTPHPFPLVQMTRTFLFLYVFTLPLALLSDVTSPFGHVFTIFVLTYGYVGLEMVVRSLLLHRLLFGKKRKASLILHFFLIPPGHGA